MLDDGKFFLSDIDCINSSDGTLNLYRNSTRLSWVVKGENSGINLDINFSPNKWVSEAYKLLGNSVGRDYKPFIVSDTVSSYMHNFIIGDGKISLSEYKKEALKKSMSKMINVMYRYNSDFYIQQSCDTRYKNQYGGSVFKHYPINIDMSLYDATSINEKYNCLSEYTNIDIKKHKRVFIFALNSNCGNACWRSNDWEDSGVCNIFAFDGEDFLNSGYTRYMISDEFYAGGQSVTLDRVAFSCFNHYRELALNTLHGVLKNIMISYPGLPIDQIQVLPNTNSNLCGYNLIPYCAEVEAPSICMGTNINSFSMYYDSNLFYVGTPSNLLNFVICLEA